MKTKKIILIAVVVVVVVGAGIWLFAGSPAKHKVTYATATVSKGDISNSVTATGTIEPVTEVEVGTQVSGIIDKIYVDYNLSLIHICSEHRALPSAAVNATAALLFPVDPLAFACVIIRLDDTLAGRLGRVFETLRVNDTSGVPVWIQIRNHMIFLIRSGHLRPGDTLPTAVSYTHLYCISILARFISFPKTSSRPC